VPRCEILMPSSGARGTIRAGNFGQITNVLQSGGEEGMWTFERYQRWMDQMTEWVRPAPDAAAYNSGDSRLSMRAPAHRSAAHSAAAQPALGQTAAGQSGAGQSGAAKSQAQRSTLAKPAPLDDVIEVPAEDMDLAQLAELAKKVVDRKPQ